MRLAVFRYEHGVVSQNGRAFAPKQVDNSIARHAKQPRAHLLHRFHQPVSSNQFIENFLKNVFGVAIIRDVLADELAQPSLFPRNHFGDPPVLIGGGSAGAKHFFHPPHVDEFARRNIVEPKSKNRCLRVTLLSRQNGALTGHILHMNCLFVYDITRYAENDFPCCFRSRSFP